MARANVVRTSVSVALAAFLVVTAILIVPGAQAVTVSAPVWVPGNHLAVAVTFDDPDLTALDGLRLHFDCQDSGQFSETIGQEPGSRSLHATVLNVVTGDAAAGYGYLGADVAGSGYGYLQVGQTGYGYSNDAHGYHTGATGAVSTGYGYDANQGYGYGYNNGYGYGYDSGTLVFVFAMVQAEFEPLESCTLVVEVVPVGHPSGDFEGPRSLPFIPRIPPEANAGEDLARVPGALVTLDGTMSVDDNDGPEPLTYAWEQEGGPQVLDLEGALTAEPAFIVPNAIGQTLVFNLTVSDGLDSDWDRVLVDVRLVTAPADAVVLEGDLVDLVGAAAPGLAVKWTTVSGAPAAFASGGQFLASTAFQAPEVDDDTLVTLRITGTQGQTSAHDDVTFLVRDNEAPIANAGADAEVVAGQVASLNGLLSSDPDSADAGQLTFAWSKISGPGTLTDPAIAAPGLVIPVSAVAQVTVAKFLLEVTDPAGVSGFDTVEIVVQPAGLLAGRAGPDQNVLEGSLVTLRGDASTGNIVSYAWTKVQPLDAPIPVVADKNATFTAPSVTGQTIKLTYKLAVTNTTGATSFDEVDVYVRDNPGGPGSGTPQEWFLHTQDCTVVDLGVPTSANDTASEQDQEAPADDLCIRVSPRALTEVVELPAVDFKAKATRFLPAGSEVQVDLHISFLLPDGPASPLPPFDGADLVVTLLKGQTSLGTKQVTATTDDVLFGLPSTLPTGKLTYDHIAFPFTTTGALNPEEDFTFRVDVAAHGLAFVIGVEGAVASSFTFPAGAAALGAPVANAGADFTVDEGAAGVQLDGTKSADVGGSIASYAWTQIGGTPVTLGAANVAKPTFVAPIVFGDHNLRFRLVVTDADGLSSNADDVRVTVRNLVAPNLAPLANAGADIQVPEGTLVSLTGAAPDANGDFVQVRWTQPSDQPNGPAVGGAASGSTRAFYAPNVQQTTVFTFRWTARDNHGATAHDDVLITVADVPQGGSSNQEPAIIVIPDEQPTDGPHDIPDEETDDEAEDDDADDSGEVPDDETPDEEELDSDGDGVPDRIEIALGTNPNFIGDLPSFDISETLSVTNVDGVNVITWPALDVAKGYQLWSSNSPYVLVATLDADDRSYADPAGKPTTKYKLTYFVEKTKAGGFLTDASELLSLPGWDESSATTLATSFPGGGAPSPGRALPAWAFVTVVLLAISIVTLLGVLALRGRRQA